MVNLDKIASDNLFCSPKEHVANILKFSPKFENSLSPSFVKVSWISSFKVKLCFPENNSLKRSNTTVGKLDKYFKIKDLPDKMEFKINPGLNSRFTLFKFFFLS